MSWDHSSVDDATTRDLRAELARVDWLTGAPADAVDRLLAAAQLRHLQAGDTVYGSGELPEHLFVLLEGRVGASRSRRAGDGAGETDTVWYFITDKSLTTLCLENVITGIPYYATMRVLRDDTQVLAVGADALTRLVADHPVTGLEIARHVARRLQAFTEQAVDNAVLDAARRLAKYLVRLAGSDGRTTPMTQAEFAARLATSRQSVNAALTRFTQRGWLRPERDGVYVLLDPAALDAFAGSPPVVGAEVFH